MHPKFDDFIGDFIACATTDRNLVFTIPAGKDNSTVGKHAGLTEDEMLVPVIVHRT